MRRYQLYLIVLPLVVAVACQPGQSGADTTGRPDTPGAAGSSGSAQAGDSGGVTLTVDKTDYAPGGAVVMSITSHRADTVGYNPCSNRTFERDSGGVWVVHPEPNRMCTMELRLLNPHDTHTANTEVPANASGGTYRIVLTLRPETTDTTRAGAVAATSSPFTVSATRR